MCGDTCPLCHNSIQVAGADSVPPYPNIPLQPKRHLATEFGYFNYHDSPVFSSTDMAKRCELPLLVLFGIGSTWLIVGAIIRKEAILQRRSSIKSPSYHSSALLDHRLGGVDVCNLCDPDDLHQCSTVDVYRSSSHGPNLLDYILYLMVFLWGSLVFLDEGWIANTIGCFHQLEFRDVGCGHRSRKCYRRGIEEEVYSIMA